MDNLIFTLKYSKIGGGFSMGNSKDIDNPPKGITLYRYSPENIPYDVLKNIFVGRDELFGKTFKELENAGKNKTPRFYLIVGSRGIGKSHFLIMLYHKIKQELSSLYIPVKFAEEEYSVYRASDFFLRILQEQKENVSDFLPLSNEDEILDASLARLKEIVKKENKMYLVFVENLQEVFKQFEAKEVHKLRSIFQKNDFFSIVASSPIIFPGVSDSEEPFYNFFRIQYLRELSSDEINILLKKIAEIEDNKDFLKNFEKYKSRIEGMSHLTGGSPRLVIFFYELITRDNFEDIEKVFFKILDEHTPYYQEIFQLLTGQKRLIFDTVISSESPLTPKQIAEKSRVDASTVITQLRRLEKDGYVLSRSAGRKTYYEVRERLFRLWREMRQPLGRNKISVFVDFLKLWYTSEELKEHFEIKFHLLESGNRDGLKDLCYRVEALSSEYKVEALLKLTAKIIELGEWGEDDYDIQELKKIASQNKDRDLRAKYVMFESILYYKNNRKAIDVFKKALKFNSKDYSDLLNSGNVMIYQKLATAFDEVLELNPEDGYALINKGKTLASLNEYEKAIEMFNRILELNPKDDDALSNKGCALISMERYEDSIENFDKVLEVDPENEYALINKGHALASIEKYEEAIGLFIKAKSMSNDDLLKIVSTFSLINVYISLNNITEAFIEIESIADTIANIKCDQDSYFTEKFINFCWYIIFKELKIGNLGNSNKLIKTIFDLEPGLEKERFEASMMNFFKKAVNSGDFEVLKTVIDEIVKITGGNCPEILKPLCRAVEIVETKDIRNYYKLQIEEREIVAEIVQKLSKSEDLFPPEYKKR
jgi:uncharacterized protein